MQCGVAQPSIASYGHAWAPMAMHGLLLKYVIIADRPGPDSSAAAADAE
jgi:hypothetical protein